MVLTAVVLLHCHDDLFDCSKLQAGADWTATLQPAKMTVLGMAFVTQLDVRSQNATATR